MAECPKCGRSNPLILACLCSCPNTAKCLSCGHYWLLDNDNNTIAEKDMTDEMRKELDETIISITAFKQMTHKEMMDLFRKED